MPANKAGRSGRQAPGLADLKRLSKEASKAAESARKKAAAAARTTTDTRHQATDTGNTGSSAVPILSGDDVQLFRRTMKTVTPIRNSQRVVLSSPPAAGAELLRQRRERAVGQEPSRLPQASDHYRPARIDDDDAHYLHPAHGPDIIKNLRRGKWSIDASVDLHGNTLDEARARLDRFLKTCLDHQIKCVRVVHGKGYGSKGGEPVLKQTVRRWLTQLVAVIAYVECQEHDGGTGAVQVLLQTQSDEPYARERNRASWK
ncbi:Smr/MutS family protein [Pollutimonas harenae]|uniref:Smr/MutS family protein n=1 Tax=Pollutimonas harenae TaxID=657015 RepID=A0A853H4D3_9BURK|nr:Smr/MutS family protein [Pollutimonas harenae]NYT85423.1 Smr/MutS family protein [Pollutimonas harenae]TEA70517.1 hypothetical protein ERD84_07460 [Pollutimonas harenae]